MGKNIIELLVTGRDLSEKELKQVSKNIDEVGKSMQEVGAVGMAAGAALAAGITLAVKASAELEEQILNALTLVDAYGDQLQSMKQGMKSLSVSMSRDLNLSAKDISSGYYQVLSAGTTALSEDFKGLTTTALKLSKVVGLETAQSVEILADTVNSFKGEMKDASKFADVFFMTSKLTATTVPQLADAMRQAGPAAAGLGVALNTTAAIIAGFAAKGIKGAEAGTAFRTIIARLAAPTKEVNQSLDALGVSVFDTDGNIRNMIDILVDLQESLKGASSETKAMHLRNIAGMEGFSKLAALIDFDLKKMKLWEQQLDSTGSLQKAFQTKLEGLSERYKAVTVEIENAKTALGDIFAPAISEALVLTREYLIEVTTWIEKNPELVASIVAVSVALSGSGGLIFALGTAIRLINKLKVAIAALSIGGAGFALLSVVVANLAIAFDLIRRKMKETKQQLDALVSEEYKIKIETPELDLKGIKFAIDQIKGAEFLKFYVSELERLRKLPPGEVITIIDDKGEKQLATVGDQIENIQKKIADIRVRMDLEPPEEQIMLEAIDAEIKRIENVLAGKKVIFPSFFGGKNQEIIRDEYLGYLRNLKQTIETTGLPEGMKAVKGPIDVFAGTEVQEAHVKAWEELAAVNMEAARKYQAKMTEVTEWIAENDRKNHARLMKSAAGSRAGAGGPVGEFGPQQLDFGSSYYKMMHEMSQGIKEQGLMEEGKIKIFSDEELQEAQENLNRLENIFNSGIQRMMMRGENFGEMMKEMFRGMSAAALAELGKIIAKTLALIAIKTLAGIFGGPFVGIAGLLKGGGARAVSVPAGFNSSAFNLGVPGLQGGGTLMRGVVGMDSTLVRAGRGETMFSHKLTNRMERFLDDQEGDAVPHSVTHVQINAGVYTGTEGGGIQFAGFSEEKRDYYERKNIARGEQ